MMLSVLIELMFSERSGLFEKHCEAQKKTGLSEQLPGAQKEKLQNSTIENTFKHVLVSAVEPASG